MRNSRAAVSGLAIGALAFAGACADTPPTEPLPFQGDIAALFGAPPQNPQLYAGTLDAHFVRTALRVPGFAGHYRGEDGTLHVVMKSGASAVPLHRELGAFNVVEGQYDFLELDTFTRRVAPVLGLTGVVFTDADEAANRVRIGVADAAAAAAVEQTLAMLDVPREAVIVSLTDPIVTAQTLQSRVRPVAGGLQIAWPRGPSWFACTVGFNVRSPDNPGVHGFVTNSHCTTNEFGTGPTGTPYYQNLPPALGGVDTFIGTEVHDTPTFTGGACPAGRQCRWCDAAGVRYAPNIENAFARIYRTTGVNNFSLVIDPANPMFNIVAEQAFPFVGDPIHKVGRTTGWTSGTVTQSCVDTNVGGTSVPNLTLLCQEHVSSATPIVAGGDSGAPTFHPFPPGQLATVRLNGILWGGNEPGTTFVFCAMNELRFENPPPPGVSAWRTFPPP